MCGRTTCSLQDSPNGYKYLCCETYKFQISISDEIFGMKAFQRNRLLNLIFERVLKTPLKRVGEQNRKWYFFFSESYQTTDTDEPNYINVAEEVKSYPRNAIEKIDRVMGNLSIRYPNIGDPIDWSHGYEPRLLFSESENLDSECSTIVRFLQGLAYFDIDPMSGSGTISFKGWKKIDELETDHFEKHQGFIAMSFSPDARAILEVFKKAITSTGYMASVISEKEHNNQIVPEIFYEIIQSQFVVVDVTYPNYGAYYEAGYGQALGKQVIVCCRKAEFDSSATRPHFDIAQKAMVIWETEDDLMEKLVRRIQATAM